LPYAGFGGLGVGGERRQGGGAVAVVAGAGSIYELRRSNLIYFNFYGCNENLNINFNIQNYLLLLN
jgi:hypothetical protein